MPMDMPLCSPHQTTSPISTPLDRALAEHQGVRLVFSLDARMIYGLSGTDGQATLRLYLERYGSDPSRPALAAQDALADLAVLAFKIA